MYMHLNLSSQQGFCGLSSKYNLWVFTEDIFAGVGWDFLTELIPWGYPCWIARTLLECKNHYGWDQLWMAVKVQGLLLISNSVVFTIWPVGIYFDFNAWFDIPIEREEKMNQRSRNWVGQQNP